MLAGILNAVCSGESSLGQEALREAHEVGTSKTFGHQDVQLISALKNALVGSEPSKAVALRLGVVEELLSVLTDVEEERGETKYTGGDGGHGNGVDTSGRCTDDITLHTMGIFAILISSSAAQDSFSASGAKIIVHIGKAIRVPSDKVRCTALRALTAMCRSMISPTDPSLELTRLWGAAPLLEAAQFILEGIASDAWTPALRTLGVEALSAMTRDRDIAKNLGPSVVSTGTVLLRPALPARSVEPSMMIIPC